MRTTQVVLCTQALDSLTMESMCSEEHRKRKDALSGLHTINTDY